MDREFRGIRLKMRKLSNYDQNINSLAFSWFYALFREIRDRLIFPYKISKNSIFIQTKNKKVKSFSKIKKLDSFFDFHIKLQNREMHLLALILGFGD